MIRLFLTMVLIAFAAPEVAMMYPAESPPQQVSRSWPHHGLFARFDRAALRRGFQVYRQACASCHSLKLVAYRDLAIIGLTLDEAKAIAEMDRVKTPASAAGGAVNREARLSDRLVAPYSSNQAARAANNGLLPPDLSQIIKTRKNGENVFYSMLNSNGVKDQFEKNAVTYADGTAATSKMMAADIVSFLAWTAEPSLEERKYLGFIWMLFFAVLTVSLFFLNRRIWSKLDKGQDS